MKGLLFALRTFSLILFFASSSLSQTNVSGNITSNTTWTKANGPYILTGNIGIPADYTLTIEAGTQIQRASDYQILINSAIKINGNPTDSVVFSSSAGIGISNKFFIEFQKSNLTNSSMRMVVFKN